MPKTKRSVNDHDVDDDNHRSKRTAIDRVRDVEHAVNDVRRRRPNERQHVVIERPNGCVDAYLATTTRICCCGVCNGGGCDHTIVALAADSSWRRVYVVANTQRFTNSITIVVSSG